METLYPNSCFINPGSNDFFSHSTEWTKEQNKQFEKGLAVYDKETPDRWWNIANMAGRSIEEVIAKYRELLEDVSEIEAGRFPVPGYLSSSSFALEGTSRDYDGYRKKHSSGGNGRTVRGGSSDQERKKGVPWTEDEHRRFLKGLMKYGKGDWRSISRNFVFTKTPTQVASHAQKYFIRQQLCESGVKDKRRPSIHDITTNNLTEFQYNNNNSNNTISSSSHFDHQNKTQQIPNWTSVGWSWLEERALQIFRANQGSDAVADFSNGFKMQENLLQEASADGLLGIQSNTFRING